MRKISRDRDAERRQGHNPHEETRKDAEAMARIDDNFQKLARRVDQFRQDHPDYKGSYDISSIRAYENKLRSKENQATPATTPQHRPSSTTAAASEAEFAKAFDPPPAPDKMDAIDRAIFRHQAQMREAEAQRQAHRAAAQARKSHRGQRGPPPTSPPATSPPPASQSSTASGRLGV